MNRLLILIIMVISIAGNSVAQNSYERIAGGNMPDWFRHVLPTSDGGCITAGDTRSFGFGDINNTDGYAVKWNSQGDTLWTRHFGTVNNEEAVSSIENANGYFIVGYNVSATNGYDFYVAQYDVSGNYIGENFYGGSGSEAALAAVAVPGERLALSGYSTTYTNGGTDMYFITVDNQGAQVHDGHFGGAGNETALGMTRTADGGFVGIGYSNSTDPNYNIYVVRVDSDLNLVWAKDFGTGLEDVGFDVAEDGLGNLWLLGYETISPDSSYMVLIKTDANGENAVTLHPATHAGDLGNSIRRTVDGGFIIAGVTGVFGMGSQILLEKLDANGDTVWTRRFGGTMNEYGNAAGVDADGNLYIAGETDGFGISAFDGYLVKVDADGNTPCPAEVSFEMSSDEICEDQTIFFTNTTVSSQQFLWEVNGNSFSDDVNAGYYFSEGGNYQVTLEACSVNASQLVLVHAKPPVHFTYTVSGNSVDFTLDPAAVVNAASVTWNFGDGSPVDSVTVNPSHTYAVPFDYWVVVSVVDSFGCDSMYAEQLDFPTGIGEFSSGDVKLFPNPASDLVIIECDEVITAISIYSASGKLIMSQAAGKNEMEFSLDEFPAGMYLVKMDARSGLVRWAKLLVSGKT